jgi:hypothetical protein
MALPETCVVGEAYGFSLSSYMRDCDRCTVFSRAFLRHFRAGSHDALLKAGGICNSLERQSQGGDIKVEFKSQAQASVYDAFVRFDNRVLITYK